MTLEEFRTKVEELKIKLTTSIGDRVFTLLEENINSILESPEISNAIKEALVLPGGKVETAVMEVVFDFIAILREVLLPLPDEWWAVCGKEKPPEE